MEARWPAMFAVSSQRSAASAQHCTATLQDRLAKHETSNERMTSQINQLAKELSDFRICRS